MRLVFNPFTGSLQFINEDGAPGAGIVVKGAYAAGTDYAVGDSVDYLGSSYVMFLDAVTGTLPTDTTYWQVLANKGAIGATGATGSTGADGPNNITTSTTTNLTGFLKGNGSVVSADNSTYQTSLSEGTDYLNKTHLDAAYAPVSVVNYTLPTAATATLGGVKVGDRLSINTGVLSADVQTTDISGKVDKVAGSRLITTAEGTILGNTSNTNSGDNATNTQYSGLVSNATHSGDVTGDTALTIANKVTMTATAPVTVSGSPTVIAGGAVAIAIPAATASVNGYATSTQITKLDGISTAATANTKNTAAETTTGTDDAKFLTSLSNAGGSVLSTGWTSAAESWAYATSTTITVPSGAAAKYGIGDKIKLTQTTVKYFYVISVADTVLTVVGAGAVVVADAAISANYYSHQSNPVGFPRTFTYTPVWTLNGGTLDTTYTVQNGEFTISGGFLTVWFYFRLNVVTTATATKAFQINPPFSTSFMLLTTLGAATGAHGTCRFYDNLGGLQNTGMMCYTATDIFEAWSATGGFGMGRTPDITLATADRWAGTFTIPML